jgi:hypothetical protein
LSVKPNSWGTIGSITIKILKKCKLIFIVFTYIFFFGPILFDWHYFFYNRRNTWLKIRKYNNFWQNLVILGKFKSSPVKNLLKLKKMKNDLFLIIFISENKKGSAYVNSRLFTFQYLKWSQFTKLVNKSIQILIFLSKNQ